MTKKPDGRSINGETPFGSSLEADRVNQAAAPPLGVWRLADLLTKDRPAPAMLQDLRRIHEAARHVIGIHLRSSTLDRDRLKRLRASVARQADQARELEHRLSLAQSGEDLMSEIAALRRFLESALEQFERQLGPLQ